MISLTARTGVCVLCMSWFARRMLRKHINSGATAKEMDENDKGRFVTWVLAKWLHGMKLPEAIH